MFKVLKDTGATLNKKKCMFFAKQNEYVGFLIDRNGMHINPNKIKAINKLPEPNDLKQLENFLGGSNYYLKVI